MRTLLAIFVGLSLVGCAGKATKKAEKAVVVGTVSRAVEQTSKAKKSVSAAKKATVTTGDALKDATKQNQTIESLLEELIQAL